MTAKRVTPAEADWPRLQAEYEEGRRPLREIAAEADLSPQGLVARARHSGWRQRGKAKSRINTTRQAIARMKTLLLQRLEERESSLGLLTIGHGAAEGEREIRAMHMLVRTLEKVLELEGQERGRRRRTGNQPRRHHDAEREALARKLSELRAELGAGPADCPDPQPSGGGDPQSGLAPVGP